MGLIAVQSNGAYVDLAPPSAMSTVPNEIVKSSRNTLGTLYKYRIAVKTSIALEWWGVTSAQKTRICSLTEPNQFNVRYFDMSTSMFKYGQFYRGSDFTIEPIGRFDGSDFDHYRITMSLVEF